MKVSKGMLWRAAGWAAVLAIFAGVIFLARPSSSNFAGDGQLQVVAAENFWGDIASQLGGGHVHVLSIIDNPNADPHLYESNAQDAAAVSRADVVVENGLGYDDFMNKLLDATTRANQRVVSVSQALHVPPGANQHLWYDIPRIPQVAAKITASYIVKDPAHRSDYQRNLTKFDQSLRPILQAIVQIKQSYAGTSVAYTEPVPGYLLRDAGLTVKTPADFAKSIEDGDDPSPADTNAMDTLMTGKTVRVLFYNAQATSPVTEHVKALARQGGIPVIGVTETLPAHENYQTWQQKQLDQLLHALEVK